MLGAQSLDGEARNACKQAAGQPADRRLADASEDIVVISPAEAPAAISEKASARESSSLRMKTSRARDAHRENPTSSGEDENETFEQIDSDRKTSLL
jgi:hypothetical protein